MNDRIRSFLDATGNNVAFDGSNDRLAYSFGDLVSVNNYIMPFWRSRGRSVNVGPPYIGYVVRETAKYVRYLKRDDLENNNQRAILHQAGKQNVIQIHFN